MGKCFQLENTIASWILTSVQASSTFPQQKASYSTDSRTKCWPHSVLTLLEFKKHLDSDLRHVVWFSGRSFKDPGVKLDDHCGFLPIRDILQFCEIFSSLQICHKPFSLALYFTWTFPWQNVRFNSKKCFLSETYPGLTRKAYDFISPYNGTITETLHAACYSEL